MKLIQKTTRYYLTFILLILGLGTGLFYFLIKIVLIDSADDGLRQESDQIIANLNIEKDVEELSPSNHIKIYKIKELKDVKDSFRTVQEFDSSKGDYTDYREFKSTFAYNHNYYQIIIRHSLEEAETLLNGLFPMVIILFLALLLGIYVINNFIFRKLWEPFYELLNTLRNYDLNHNKVIKYEHSDIQEFNELSNTLERMTALIYNDYIAQKEFNENSSHELQTPLAVIGNKLDLLIQSRNLKEEELIIVQSIYDAVKKLKGLNKGLILLNKIENRQYSFREPVNISLVITKTLDDFSFQIEEMELNLKTAIQNNVIIFSNPALIDILINNLISNSIKHNKKEGDLFINLSKEQLAIENTGKYQVDNPESMFERFKKNSENPQSVGLGLAIVKKICDSLEYKISYQTQEDKHSMVVGFEEALS